MINEIVFRSQKDGRGKARGGRERSREAGEIEDGKGGERLEEGRRGR